MGENIQQRLIGALLLLAAIVAVAIFLVNNANEGIEQQVETIQPDFVTSVDTKPLHIQSSEPEALLDPHQLGALPTKEEPKEVVLIPPQQQKQQAVSKQEKPTKVDAVKQKVVVSSPQWVIQLASFSQQNNAKALVDSVKKLGLQAHIESVSQNNKTNYRVRIGPESNRNTVDDIVRKISQKLALKPQVITVKAEK